MDTRRKIVGAEEALEAARRWRENGGSLAVRTGYFDVLLADHARELAAMRNGHENVLLVAIVAPVPEPVLTARARAELVAGMAVVDYVVIAEEGIEALVAAFAADVSARNEAADDRRMRQLIEYVQCRQTGG